MPSQYTHTCPQCNASFVSRDKHTRHCGNRCAAIARNPLTILDRLHANIVVVGDCWLWTGPTSADGYGYLRIGSRSDGTRGSVRIHRLAYELAHGPVPKGLCVCHSCDHPQCINPAHLWVGTRAQNNADRVRKGRSRNKQSGPLTH